MQQMHSIMFAERCVEEVVWIVANSQEAESLGQQLLSGKTALLMASALDGMLAALQVPTPDMCCHNVQMAALQAPTPPQFLLQCTAGCPPGAHTPTCVATMYRWLLSRRPPPHKFCYNAQLAALQAPTPPHVLPQCTAACPPAARRPLHTCCHNVQPDGLEVAAPGPHDV
jgi:hypothetical protein